MPAPRTHQPLSDHTRSCLLWDVYDEAAYEMWEYAGSQNVSHLLLKHMADRLRELFMVRTP